MLFCIVKDALLHGKRASFDMAKGALLKVKRAPFTLLSITTWESEYYETEKYQNPSYS